MAGVVVKDWVTTGFESAGMWLSSRLEKLRNRGGGTNRRESSQSPPLPTEPEVVMVTPDTIPSFPIKDQIQRLLLGFAGILLWDKYSKTISAYSLFNFVFWACIALNIGGIIAAYSAALVMLCYVDYVTSTEEINIPTSQLVLIRKESFSKLVKNAKSRFQSIAERELEPCSLAMFFLTLAAFILAMVSILEYYLIVFFSFTTSLAITKILKTTPLEELKLSNKVSDSDEEFLPRTTECDLEVLKWAGETGDNPPTLTVMNFSRDSINEDDLQGLEMPSHEDCIDSNGLESRSELDPHPIGRSVMPSHEDCVDSSLDLCSDLLPDPPKSYLVSRPYYLFDTASSEDDDSSDSNLEPKKDDKNWNEIDSDDSDFEIIDVRELNNVGNV